MLRRVIYLTLLMAATVLVGCQHLIEIDRSNLNSSVMDIRKKSLHGASTPSSGLRELGASSGGGACSVCAH